MTRSAARQPISIQATPEKVGTGFSSGVAANQDPMTRSAAFQPISIQATPEKVGTGFSSGVAANQDPMTRSAALPADQHSSNARKSGNRLRPIKTP
jgi:hypothetical protein